MKRILFIFFAMNFSTLAVAAQNCQSVLDHDLQSFFGGKSNLTTDYRTGSAAPSQQKAELRDNFEVAASKFCSKSLGPHFSGDHTYKDAMGGCLGQFKRDTAEGKSMIRQMSAIERMANQQGYGEIDDKTLEFALPKDESIPGEQSPVQDVLERLPLVKENISTTPTS